MASSDSSRISVCVRVRPLGSARAGSLSVDSDTSLRIARRNPSSGAQESAWSFDRVLGPAATQGDVYEGVVQRLVDRWFEGFNASLLAYGQTGSGKTHTVLGPPCAEDGSRGAVQRVLQAAFHRVENLRRRGLEADVHLQFLEIYNEEIRDLLCDEGEVRLHQDAGGNVLCSGAERLWLEHAEHAMGAVRDCMARRSTASTQLNDVSSRSHAVITLHLSIRKDGNEVGLASKFHLADLAGSERSKKSLSTGARFKEMVSINGGLLALGKVIAALTKAGGADPSAQRHVPYRDSKLTRLLRDSLGGNAHTAILVCLNAAQEHLGETSNTLHFASRARHVKNRPVVNVQLLPSGASAAPGDANVTADVARRMERVHRFLERLEPRIEALLADPDAAAPPTLPERRTQEELGAVLQSLQNLKALGPDAAAAEDAGAAEARLRALEADLEEARADLRRDERIFEDKQAELRGAIKRSRSLERDLLAAEQREAMLLERLEALERRNGELEAAVSLRGGAEKEEKEINQKGPQRVDASAQTAPPEELRRMARARARMAGELGEKATAIEAAIAPADEGDAALRGSVLRVRELAEIGNARRAELLSEADTLLSAARARESFEDALAAPRSSAETASSANSCEAEPPRGVRDALKKAQQNASALQQQLQSARDAAAKKQAFLLQRISQLEGAAAPPAAAEGATALRDTRKIKVKLNRRQLRERSPL